MVLRVAPSSVLSMADPKAALKSRPWGAFFIGPALVCLETCDPEMMTKATGPKAAFQSRRCWVAFFIGPALICLETCDPEMTTKEAAFSKPALGCIFHKAGPGLPRGR